MPVETISTLEKFNTSVVQTKYSRASVKKIGSATAEIRGVYPFKVRFRDLGYPGYSPSNPAAIGIAIIGSTFYIL
jgi:hypothetical protein